MLRRYASGLKFGYVGEDTYLDALEEARREEFLDNCVTCADCGTHYDHRYHRATRYEPAWPERDECPLCGCSQVK